MEVLKWHDGLRGCKYDLITADLVVTDYNITELQSKNLLDVKLVMVSNILRNNYVYKHRPTFFKETTGIHFPY